jgi:hypothetical protein
VRAFRPFGRSQLIVASLASIAALTWVAWRWTDIHTTGSLAPEVASARAGAPAPPAAPHTRIAPALASAGVKGHGDARRSAVDPGPSDDRPRLARAPAAAPVGPGVAGTIVAIDPETGQLGAPSPEQMRALELAGRHLSVNRTDEGLRETVLANGTVILHLDGRFQDYAIARVDRTGRLVQGCAHDVHGPATALRDSTATRGLEVE